MRSILCILAFKTPNNKQESRSAEALNCLPNLAVYLEYINGGKRVSLVFAVCQDSPSVLHTQVISIISPPLLIRLRLHIDRGNPQSQP